MRKKISLFLAFALTLLLTSCGLVDTTNDESILRDIASLEETPSNNLEESINSSWVDEVLTSNSPIENETSSTNNIENSSTISKSSSLINESILEENESILNIYYIDVGQGDATLLECDGKYMLIDAGDNDKGSFMKQYLNNLGVETLDIVVGTHADSDHIGGLDVVLYNFDCKTILLPNTDKSTATYRDVLDTIKHKDYKVTTPLFGDTFYLGEAEIKILRDCDSISKEENNNSIVLLVTHLSHTFLFTGDLEEEEENLSSIGHVDVYQAGHHGSRSSTSLSFYEDITPTYAVISCGENNSYGHPHAETLNTLRMGGTSLFRTDVQGTIVITSSKNGLTFNASPCDDWTPGEPKGSSSTNTNISIKEEVPTQDAEFIIGNKNSLIYHIRDCGSLPSEKNRVYFETEEEAVSSGMRLCNNCKK